MESVEDIILRHSRRGMDRLRPLLRIFATPRPRPFSPVPKEMCS